MENTSILLDNNFEQFARDQISTGRYKNASELVRAGLILLEDEESKTIALRAEIQKGLESPRVDNFDFKENLHRLKEEQKING